MSIVNEEWCDIAGYEGYYQVSNLGRVRSCDRLVRRNGIKVWLNGRILKFNLDAYGYPRLSLAKDGRKATRTIHPLVAQAFCQHCSGCDQVNHINGIKTDNRAENLEWTTQAENNRHAIDTGLRPPMIGSQPSNTILNEMQVLEIRNLRADGLKLRVIAEIYGISLSAVSGVVYRNNWKHL